MDKIKIDIDGPDGNAHVLLGYAKKYAAPTEKLRIMNEMMVSDYINLLKVFNKNFGHIIELVTCNTEYIDELS